MSALTFILKQLPRQRVNMAPLSVDKIAGLSIAQIGAIELQCGKRSLRTDQLFDLMGHQLFDLTGHDHKEIVIKNCCDKLDYIGQQMSSGKVTIEGDAGGYLGQGMSGGTILVDGSAGLFTGCEMRGGLIQVEGNIGDFAGGALPGNKKGMRGGMMIIKGSTGDRAGDQMRRGTILVEGSVGSYCGSRMIAGTIAVMGKVGPLAGYAMNRGTLLFWHGPENISSSFADCGTHTFSSFLPLLFRSFSDLDSRFADRKMWLHRIHRYQGDLAALGKGEILIKSQ